MSTQLLWRALLSLLSMASLATLGILIDASGAETGGAWWLVGFALWAVSPYVGLALLGWLARRHRARLWVDFVGAVVLVAFGLLAYVDAFFVHVDAQNALLIVFVPLYQWTGTVLLGCAIGLIALFRKKAVEPSAAA